LRRGAAFLGLICAFGCAGGRPAASPSSAGDERADATRSAGTAGVASADTAAATWPLPAPADRWFPVALLPLSDGSWAVAETDQNRIFLLDVAGRVSVRLPGPGRARVEWTALAPAPGLSFYALDGPGRAVHQYDLRGNYLGVAIDLARLADDEGLGMIEPAGLAVDRSGLAVITDRIGDRLLVFGPGWGFRGAWGQTGSERGSWRRPGAVAVGDRPPFIVCDEGNSRIVLIDEMGGVRGMRSWADPPRGVAALSREGYVVVSGDSAQILDAALLPRRMFALRGSGPCAGRAYATGAVGVAAGLLLVGEGCSGRLAAFRVSGD
jgi:hypothetical protein